MGRKRGTDHCRTCIQGTGICVRYKPKVYRDSNNEPTVKCQCGHLYSKHGQS